MILPKSGFNLGSNAFPGAASQSFYSNVSSNVDWGGGFGVDATGMSGPSLGAGSGAKSGGIFGMSNAGALTALGAGMGLVGDIAGIFAKDAAADSANYQAKLQHQSNLQTWKHRNDESLRQSLWQIDDWANKNISLRKNWNAQVDAYDFRKNVFDRTNENLMAAADSAYKRSYTNFQRQQDQAGLADEASMREYLSAIGTRFNEQTGASAARRMWNDDVTQAVNTRDSLLMRRDAMKNLEDTYDDTNIRLTSGLNNAWAALGLPPIQPTMLAEPFLARGPATSPMRAARVSGSDWTDWAKAGGKAALSIAGVPGGLQNFFL